MAIKPNFLIVGAAKSGTTSLYQYLRRHPQVFMPDRKEPSYFVPEAGGIGDWKTYLNLFEAAKGYPRVGEASVSYLMAPEAPGKIAAALGRSVKIIILLRDPVAMAYSNWGHQVREGNESASFLDALRDETRRLRDPFFSSESRTWIYNRTYIERARYLPQVKRYLDTFGTDNVAVFLFEEFFASGMPLYAELCLYLEIDDSYRPENKAYNRAGTVRSEYVRRVLHERMSWKEPLKRVIPQPVRRTVMGALAHVNRVERPLPELPKEAASLIRSALKHDVAGLCELLDRDLFATWGFDE